MRPDVNKYESITIDDNIWLLDLPAVLYFQHPSRGPPYIIIFMGFLSSLNYKIYRRLLLN